MIHAPVSHIELLLSPIDLGPIELKNRICMPAMHLNFSMGGEVSDQLVRFYSERASGGVAMITVGGCSVDVVGSGPIMIGLHEDRFVAGLQRLSAGIHQGGAKAIAQLYHAGKYAYSMVTGQQAISASAIRSKLTKETPRALTIDEIEQVQTAFVRAAERAVQAGFDGVEILASAGYLISQFLSPVSNQRDDGYGGTFDNRVRFGREIVEKVRRAVGADRAVIVRVAGADYVPGGLDNDASAQASQVFAEAGADAINVTGGWHETRVPQLTMGVPRGAFLYLAQGIRRHVDVPVIASNRCNDPFLAEAALRDGVADLINFGRPLIADPDLPKKTMAGKTEQIVHCIACNQGCFDHVFAGRPVACMVNPRAGREAQLALKPSAQPKRVVVVGGGPAGITAAITAARRGHQVTLLERSGQLGGQLLIAGITHGRQELGILLEDLKRQLAEQPVEVLLETEGDPAEIVGRQPDLVVLATGARPMTPQLAGADLPHVVQAWDVLAGRVRVGRDVVVVGGGAVAVDVALDLAQRGTLDGETLRFLLLTRAEEIEVLRERCLHGAHKVTIVEMQDKLGKGIGKTTRWTLLQALKMMDVSLLDTTQARRIEERGVWVERVGENKEQLISADTVVLATGAEPCCWLADALPDDVQVLTVGDAKSPRRAFEAIHEGFQAGMSV